jgi:hypothetical protein
LRRIARRSRSVSTRSDRAGQPLRSRDSAGSSRRGPAKHGLQWSAPPLASTSGSPPAARVRRPLEDRRRRTFARKEPVSRRRRTIVFRLSALRYVRSPSRRLDRVDRQGRTRMPQWRSRTSPRWRPAESRKQGQTSAPVATLRFARLAYHALADLPRAIASAPRSTATLSFPPPDTTSRSAHDVGRFPSRRTGHSRYERRGSAANDDRDVLSARTGSLERSARRRVARRKEVCQDRNQP